MRGRGRETKREKGGKQTREKERENRE